MNYIESIRSEESKSYLDSRPEEVFKESPEANYLLQIKYLDNALNISIDTIEKQVKPVRWLEYMGYMAHCSETPEDLDLWKQQTMPVFNKVSKESQHSDKVPVYKKEWYE